MNMNTRHLLSISSILIGSYVLSGCDVSSGSSDGGVSSSSQDPDPVVIDFPIAYIERPIPLDEDGEPVADDILDPSAFNPGARLFFKARAQVSAPETIITEGIFPMVVDEDDPDAEPMEPLYDVKDLTVSYDGLRLLFAMRAPELENVDEDDQPTWNIWEYNLETATLRRIIESDINAEGGQDVDPAYLPDGRIVFSSTRQRRSKAILLDENKPQFSALTEDGEETEAFLLHVMDEDGSNLEQITFNQSHDLEPTVLDSGEIVFLRWDNYATSNLDRLSLYKTNPDGSGTELLYGYHSQDTGTNDTEATFIDPIQTPAGELLVTLRSRQSLRLGGDLITIDTANFVENDRTTPTAAVTGTAQKSATVGTIFTDDSVSPRGYFNSAFPIFDGTNRLLVSWSSCFVQGVNIGVYVNLNGELINDMGEFVNEDGDLLADDEAPVVPDVDDIGTYPCSESILDLPEIAEAPPMFGLWTYDPLLETQTPVVLAKTDTIYSEAVVMDERPLPLYIPPIWADPDVQALADEDVGVVHIHSVYDFHGEDNTTVGIAAMRDPAQTPADQRPARFIRIMKAVSMPDEDVYDFDNSAFGRAGRQMKDILGYVPVEPDGSAMFKVPADVAFTFSILDANGRRVPGYLGDRHRNWLSVRAGETRQCGGCHTGQEERPHGRSDAEIASANTGALGGVPFENSVLLDEFDTPHPAPEVGETMAAYYARLNGARTPSVNIYFNDDWTDANVMPKFASYELEYADLPSATAPVSSACQSNWNSLCRVVINYVDHIQPLWEVDRQVFDAMDVLVEDRTCTSCHNQRDADGMPQVPAGQLELVADQSPDNADYYTSFDELFFPDVPQEIVDGALIDETVQATDANGNLLFQTDVDGNLILDVDGNPIPILVTVAARPAYVNSAGARSNTRFFNIFVPGGTHDGYMEPAELKLLSEWLDIGGQYYNNPFDAPAN